MKKFFFLVLILFLPGQTCPQGAVDVLRDATNIPDVTLKKHKKIAGIMRLVSFALVAGGGTMLTIAKDSHNAENSLTMGAVGAMGVGALLGLARIGYLEQALYKELVRYQQRVTEFLRTWPQRRDRFPEELRAPFDLIMASVAEKKGLITGDLARKLYEALEAYDALENSANFTAKDDIDRWIYTLSQLNAKAVHKARPYWWVFLGKVLWALPGNMRMSLSSLLQLLVTLGVTRHLGSASVVEGVVEGPMRSAAKELNLTASDEQIFTRNGKKLFGWTATFFFVGTLFSIARYFMDNHTADRDAYNEQFEAVDHFIAVWPFIKKNVPEELHAFFDRFHTTVADPVMGGSVLTNSKRRKIARYVLGHAAPYRKEIKERRQGYKKV